MEPSTNTVVSKPPIFSSRRPLQNNGWLGRTKVPTWLKDTLESNEASPENRVRIRKLQNLIQPSKVTIRPGNNELSKDADGKLRMEYAIHVIESLLSSYMCKAYNVLVKNSGGEVDKYITPG